jgi:hypothetical protein
MAKERKGWISNENKINRKSALIRYHPFEQVGAPTVPSAFIANSGE